MTHITWLSTGAASSLLGVTPSTLYRLIDHGHLPAYRMGRVIRLQRAEVLAYIESARVEPGSLQHLHPPRAAGDD
jgi:excisionase family DNA binding protein